MRAEENVLGRDLYWTYYDLRDGAIRWTGYDDAYWWNNVATTLTFCKKLGSSGRTYLLDPRTGEVTIEGAVQHNLQKGETQ